MFFKRKEVNILTIAIKSEKIEKEFARVSADLVSAHKKFEERYEDILLLYKHSKFEDSFDFILYTTNDLLSACNFYMKKVREFYEVANHHRFKPFTSYKVFNSLTEPIEDMLKGQVLLLSCLIKEQKDTTSKRKQCLIISENLMEFIKALLKANKRIGKGENSVSSKKVKMFLEIIFKDSGKLLKFSKKKDLSRKDLEELAIVKRS